MIDPTATIHPSSYVDEGAIVGPEAVVWHFCHILPGAIVGSKSRLGQNVVVMSGAKIGRNVKIQNNVSVYEGVELEDDTFCGPSCVFTNVLTPRSHVVRNSNYAKTLVKRGASLGANSTIVCGVTIGKYALVGAGAVVTKDVPDYAVVTGVPARVTGWACACGVPMPKPQEGKGTPNVWACGDCQARYEVTPCPSQTCAGVLVPFGLGSPIESCECRPDSNIAAMRPVQSRKEAEQAAPWSALPPAPRRPPGVPA